ncbi:SDR family oxidoreductase, partial [Salmonella enterica subsp. enterica serovar Minnesota]|uniref:SDR family oxidoreductase n=1 Tax=Salmonella enterica TaxID=28901 RepID=UPI003D2AD3A7
IAPGAVATPGALAAHTAGDAGSEDALKSFLDRVPAGRIGDADDIGRAALFLASDLSSYMTGTQVVVDGGVLLS